jgi:twitching motility protein PilT
MAVTIEEILTQALEAGAGDIHVMPDAVPVMRIGRTLMPMAFPALSREDTLTLLVSVMTQPQREKFEANGQLVMACSIRNLGRIRVSAYKQRGGIALALRLLGKSVPLAEELLLPEAVMQLCEERQGLIFVSGALGSGKTTTLAAMLDRINTTRKEHIITLERPVEFLHPHKQSIISQREIGTDCQSCAEGLYSAMREDADVILAGELTDVETLYAAVAAAKAGQLVLADVLGADALYLWEWLKELCSGNAMLLARLKSALTAVVLQRLILEDGEKKRRAEFEILSGKAFFQE